MSRRIDELRDTVINAAQTFREQYGPIPQQKLTRETHDLIAAVDALDVAERPDPWQLLRDVRDYDLGERSRFKSVEEVNDAMDAALAWHDKEATE